MPLTGRLRIEANTVFLSCDVINSARGLSVSVGLGSGLPYNMHKPTIVLALCVEYCAQPKHVLCILLMDNTNIVRVLCTQMCIVCKQMCICGQMQCRRNISPQITATCI